MRLRFLRESSLEELRDAVEENLDKYRSGVFSHLVDDPSQSFEVSIDFDPTISDDVHMGREREDEASNCILLWDALSGLTPVMAREERLWVYLTHTYFLEYSRTRWPIPDDDEEAVKHIRTHFFAKGARGIERDNAVSRLWWMAYLCSRVEGIGLKQSLAALLYQTDVRASIIERPTTSQNVKIFSFLIKKLHSSLEGDKKLYSREISRKLMKELNLKGGSVLLDFLDEEGVDDILENL